MNKRCIGSAFESLAAVYLEKQGLQIVDRNFRCRQGEIDLIAIDQKDYVFVEVKYRKNSLTGNPAEAVNYHKQQKICKVADYYRFSHHLLESIQFRFDIVSILGEEIVWYKNAFYYRGNL